MGRSVLRAQVGPLAPRSHVLRRRWVPQLPDSPRPFSKRTGKAVRLNRGAKIPHCVLKDLRIRRAFRLSTKEPKSGATKKIGSDHISEQAAPMRPDTHPRGVCQRRPASAADLRPPPGSGVLTPGPRAQDSPRRSGLKRHGGETTPQSQPPQGGCRAAGTVTTVSLPKPGPLILGGQSPPAPTAARLRLCGGERSSGGGRAGGRRGAAVRRCPCAGLTGLRG